MDTVVPALLIRATIALDVLGPARTLSPGTVVDWHAAVHARASTTATSWGDRAERREAPASFSSGDPISTADSATSDRSARANTVGLLVDEPGDTRSDDQARVDIADGDIPDTCGAYSCIHDDLIKPNAWPLRCSTSQAGGMSRDEVRTMGLPTPLARVLGAMQGDAAPQVHQAPAVKWLSVPQLVRTALDVLQASSFAKYAD
jgi:hypothetical protein